jgi:hypothetical protein
MITRSDVISNAVEECLKKLYSLVQPHIEWEDFLEENRIYLKRKKEWEKLPKEEKPSIKEYCGPAPYEFYYLSKNEIDEITDSYIHAYKLDSQQELLDIIEILKNYCKEPIIVKYIEKEGEPGYRGYEHPDNLQLSIYKQARDMFPNGDWGQFEEISKMSQNKFFEFLDMAGNFFKWNMDLDAFRTEIYLGASPCSNKQTVIDNWKKYRNTEIKINEYEE